MRWNLRLLLNVENIQQAYTLLPRIEQFDDWFNQLFILHFNLTLFCFPKFHWYNERKKFIFHSAWPKQILNAQEHRPRHPNMGSVKLKETQITKAAGKRRREVLERSSIYKHGIKQSKVPNQIARATLTPKSPPYLAVDGLSTQPNPLSMSSTA